MKQNTAMRKLIEYIGEFQNPVPEQIILKATELLQKEEEQIKQAYESGIKDATEISTSDFKHGQKYFNQTYQINQ